MEGFMMLAGGFLAVSEILKRAEGVARGNMAAQLPPSAEGGNRFTLAAGPKLCLRHRLTSFARPCFLGYGISKKRARHPELYGKGSMEGIFGAETANNAVCVCQHDPVAVHGCPR